MAGETTDVFFSWLVSQPVILVLLVLSIADVASGVGAAFVTKTLSSDISLKGMTKKALMWMVVAVAGALNHISTEIPILKLTAAFYCFNEGLSFCENMVRAGVPIPPIFRDALAKLNPAEPQRTTITTATATVVTTSAATADAPAESAVFVQKDEAV